jgi:predicted ferric reductase
MPERDVEMSAPQSHSPPIIHPAHAWLCLGALLLVPAVALHGTTGDLTVYFRYRVPPGQFLYVASKLCGLYALVALWLQALLGLLGPAALHIVGLQSSIRPHRVLGSLAAVLVLAHVASFVGAASLREGAPAYNFLWPEFQGFYRSALALGAIGLFCIVASIAAMILSRRPHALKVWLHRLGLVALALVLVHSYLVGSETRVGMMPVLYVLMIVTLAAASAYRVVRTVRGVERVE